MTHASLFSGIGGFDLAAEWAGWANLFNCEIDTFCQKVLKYHFPNATQYSDIRATDFTVWRGRVDVLTGGFPCQPFSVAGKRLGTDDERHLWPEMLRAIREISPRWIVGENVRGIVNWSGGLVFEQVCADLEAEGYQVQPFLIPACGVGAPHRRDRIWFVAHAASNRDRGRSEEVLYENGRPFGQLHSEPFECGCVRVTANIQCRRGRKVDNKTQLQQSNGAGFDCISGKWTTADPSRQQSEWVQFKQRETGEPEQGKFRGGGGADCHENYWQNFPTQSPVCSRNDGLSDRLDGITFPKWRAESIKAYGNAVVPEVPYQIFETINQYEQL